MRVSLQGFPPLQLEDDASFETKHVKHIQDLKTNATLNSSVFSMSQSTRVPPLCQNLFDLVLHRMKQSQRLLFKNIEQNLLKVTAPFSPSRFDNNVPPMTPSASRGAAASLLIVLPNSTPVLPGAP
jgi:hypothetical protein